MIVLDEQISDPRIKSGIEAWYPGKVISIIEARPHTRILDGVIETLLHRLKEPTFVTINCADFWGVARPHPGYSIICLNLPSKKSLEVPEILREVLRRPEFKTKRRRLGKILLVGRDAIAVDD